MSDAGDGQTGTPDGLRGVPSARPEAGAILVAGPRLLDPNFMHTVILVCAHGDEGTFGLVLNRPTQFTVGDLDTSVDLLRDREDRLFGGGPVGTAQLHVLHRTPGGLAGSIAVCGDIALDGDPALLHAAHGGGGSSAAGESRIRFFAGYAGWGSGQLDAEVAEGSWVVLPADVRRTTAVVFDTMHGTLWRRVLRAEGGATAALADLPPDPSWN